MILEILGSLGIVAGIIGLIYWLHETGVKSEKLNEAEKVLDEVHEANAARRAVKPSDSLRDDPYDRDNGV